MPSDSQTLAARMPPPPTYVTYGLVGLYCSIFLFQSVGTSGGLRFADHETFDLMRFGALNPDLIGFGDWWRMTTAPLLHGGIVHLGLNMVALYFSGKFIEHHMGGCTLAGFLAAGSLCGAVASLVTGKAWLVSVGASGGIMALMAGSLLLCFVLTPDEETVDGKSLFARILVPSLIPSGVGVDYAAHFGGALAGVALAAIMYAASYEGRDPPLRRAIALAAAAIYVAAAVFGFSRLIVAPVPADADAMVVVPRAADPLPSLAVPEARTDAAFRPFDPGARLALALALYDAGEKVEAGRQAEIGLRQIRTYGNTRYEDVAVPRLKLLLALGLAASGRWADGMVVAGPACWLATPAFRARVDIRPVCH